MKLKKSLLKKSRVYLILDRPRFKGFSFNRIRNLVARKEIGLIQLRDKVSARADVLKFAIKLAKYLVLSKTLLIINDYVDVAVASDADGVHLGQSDLSLKKVRKVLGKNKIIGISCHNLGQALKAQEEGADYIGFGPIYSTATKPEYKPIGPEVLRELEDKIKIPYFAIGDIHLGNIKEITAVGAKRVAVCRAILEASSPRKVAQRLYWKLKKI